MRMRRLLILTFLAAILGSGALWYFTGFRGVLTAAEAINWMGVFVTSLSLAFAMYILILGIDAFTHISQLRSAKADLEGMREEYRQLRAKQETVATELERTTALVSSIREAHLEFAIRLNRHTIDTVFAAANVPQEERKALNAEQQREVAAIVLEHFSDVPSLVVPQIYILGEVGDPGTLKLAQDWLRDADIPERQQLQAIIRKRATALSI